MSSSANSGLAPYVAHPSGWNHEALIDLVEQGCASYASEAGRSSTVDLFERVLDEIAAMPQRRFGSIQQVQQAESNLAVRVDVDMDISTATHMAKLANDREVPVEFYVLHTASYYGTVIDAEFHRHETMAELYLRLQGPSTSVGLHTDGLHLALNEGLDGADGVVAELSWLRQQGLRIQGTAAHNYAPMYGAENFELFAGRVIRPEGSVTRNGRTVKLGVLSEADLGLNYEAGDPRSAIPLDAHTYPDAPSAWNDSGDLRWLEQYAIGTNYVRWGYDHHVWLVGDDQWATWGWRDDGEGWFEGPWPWSRVRDHLAGVPAASRVCVTLHPIYLGRRR